MKYRLALAAVLFLGPLMTGCTQRTLFAESDPADRKLKYWGEDSAVKTAKSREQQNEWGFGFPSGSGFQ